MNLAVFLFAYSFIDPHRKKDMSLSSLDDGTVIRRRITETEAYCGEIWYNERNPLKGGGR